MLAPCPTQVSFPMHWFQRVSSVLLLLAVLTSPALAAADLRNGAARFEAFQARQQQSYQSVNAEYQAAMRLAPDDVALAIAQCKFLENFIYAEDINWVEAASTDLEKCQESVGKKWPKAPEARVYQFENNYDEGAIATGKKLWLDSKNWPNPLRARVASHLQELLDDDDEKEAGHFALAAAELGDPLQAPAAIKHLLSVNQQARAVRMVQALPPATSFWLAKLRIDALGKLKDKSVARNELDRTIAAGVEVPAAHRVNTYLAAGDLAAANRAGGDLDKNDKVQSSAKFNLALANNKPLQAARLVSLGDEFDIWVERYSRVVAHSPTLAFGLQLLPATMVLLLVLAALGLVPGLLLVPVHYRGLMRRVNGRQPSPMFERIGLRHAWIGGAVVLIVPALVACAMRPDQIGVLFSGAEGPAEQFDVAMAGVLVGLATISPWLLGLARTQVSPSQSSTLRALAAVLGCLMIVYAVSFLTVMFHQWMGSGDTSTLQTRAVEALVRNSWTEYGMFWTLMLLAVAVPVMEEVVFRGLLLGGMARHISFGWANTLQAGLFAAVHVDPPRIPFYLTVGLLAGWLVRRYGRIWPAIALHALINGIATWLNT